MGVREETAEGSNWNRRGSQDSLASAGDVRAPLESGWYLER